MKKMGRWIVCFSLSLLLGFTTVVISEASEEANSDMAAASEDVSSDTAAVNSLEGVSEEVSVETEDLEVPLPESYTIPDEETLFRQYAAVTFGVDIADMGTETADMSTESVVGTETSDASYAQIYTGFDHSVSLLLSGGEMLSSVENQIYSEMRAQLRKIADGEESSTQIDTTLLMEIPYTKLMETAGVTEEELTEILAGSDKSKLNAAVTTISAINHTNVFYALLSDCGYDLYWFDKTSGAGLKRSSLITYSTAKNEDGTINVAESKVKLRYRYKFTVAEAYAVNGTAGTFVTDTEKTQKGKAASLAAKTIVEAAAGLSDLQKLEYYRDRICELTSYNYSVSLTGTYGDPWQVIYVFDGDPETKVVCEGYAKAFDYLCEMTAFDDELIDCISVAGTLNGTNHMWNIVKMENGLRYIVDITNIDEKSDTMQKALFLGGMKGDKGTGYISIGAGHVQYVYSSYYMNLYRDELDIAPISYLTPTAYSITLHNGDAVKTIQGDLLEDMEGIELPSNTFLKKGHTLTGWNTKEDGSGTQFELNEKIGSVIFEEEILLKGAEAIPTDLYAVFDENHYSIQFVGNQGSGAVNGIADIPYSSSVKLPNNTFTRSGYAVSGWNTKADGSGKQYSGGTSVKMLSAVDGETVTLYAQWKIKAPEINKIENVSGGISLQWTWKTMAEEYFLYRSDNGGAYTRIAVLGGQKNRTFTDKNVTNGVAYSYKVAAYNQIDGEGKLSGVKTMTYLKRPVITAIYDVKNGLRLQWEKNAKAAGYLIYRKVGSNGSYELLKTISVGTTTTYTDTSATETWKVYYYKIAAYSAVSKDECSSLSAYMSKKKPLGPELKTLENKTGSVYMKWTWKNDAEGYSVYRKAEGGSFKKIAEVSGQKNTSYTDTTVVKGVTYTYKIISFNSIVGEMTPGETRSIRH